MSIRAPLFSNQKRVGRHFCSDFQGVAEGSRRFCPDFMGFCPDFYQIKTFGVAVAPLYPRLLHQCTNGTVKLVERKRPSLLCEWLWFGSHLCSFRFGGSGHTFDGTGFYLLFEISNTFVFTL